MSSYPPPGQGRGRFEEAVARIEAELRQAIAYVNDSVVPEVRRESISTIRTLSEKLRKLADRIESQSSPRNPAGGERR